jgi:hypothetical protein
VINEPESLGAVAGISLFSPPLPETGFTGFTDFGSGEMI